MPHSGRFGQIPDPCSPIPDVTSPIHADAPTRCHSRGFSHSLSEEYRREELIRIIEHSLENLTLQELEALYYDMSTKNYIND
jgi:hypothetical protein